MTRWVTLRFAPIPPGLASLALAACAMAGLCAPAVSATPPAEQGKVVGLAFVGRMVADLDRSVAFYKELGFRQDPAANPAWRRDEVLEHLYGIGSVETRMAKMYVINSSTQQHFVVYLRELRGLNRRNLSNHTAWDPGVSHFGLIVPDAERTWSQLQAASLLHAVGLDELVTETLADYERKALSLAREPAEMQALKQKLAQNLPTAPLFDSERFARNLEAAYRLMSERRGELPKAFSV